jgi:hypothetical protein
MNTTLNESRQKAADNAFEISDLLDEVSVAATLGWEFDNQSDEWSRVFFVAGEGDDPSTKELFVIRFAPGTAEVTDAYVRGWGV